jgi:hypothetical protein
MTTFYVWPRSIKKGIMMQDNRKLIESYVKLAYIALLFISLVCFFAAALFTVPGDLRNLLYGFGIQILGAVAIFFFLDKVLLRGTLNLHQRLECIADRLDGKTHFLRRVKENKHFDEVISDATEIYLVANSFGGLLRQYADSLSSCLKRGAHLKLLFLDPNGASCELFNTHSGKNLKSEIEDYIKLAQSLKENCEKSGIGAVEIKTIDWPASCSMHLIDPDKDSGYIRVTINTLHPYLDSSREKYRAHFILSKTVDKFWYESYREQFDVLWKNGKLA